MADLIDRQKAIRNICNEDCHQPIPCKWKCIAIEELEALPSVQPERKKGKWIYGEHDVAMCDGYRCDNCGFFVPWDYQHKFIDFIKDYNYCPSCGADMRGDSDEVN